MTRITQEEWNWHSTLTSTPCRSWVGQRMVERGSRSHTWTDTPSSGGRSRPSAPPRRTRVFPGRTPRSGAASHPASAPAKTGLRLIRSRPDSEGQILACYLGDCKTVMFDLAHLNLWQ